MELMRDVGVLGLVLFSNIFFQNTKRNIKSFVDFSNIVCHAMLNY